MDYARVGRHRLVMVFAVVWSTRRVLRPPYCLTSDGVVEGLEERHRGLSRIPYAQPPWPLRWYTASCVCLPGTSASQPMGRVACNVLRVIAPPSVKIV